jgi:malonate transporter and related proteins
LSFSLFLPIFLLAGLGALLGKLPWLRPGWHLGVTELTAKVLIPLLLFTSTYRTGFMATVSWKVLGAFYLPLIALFWLVTAVNRRRDDRAGIALAATYSNTVFVGLPVLVHTVGPSSLQFAYPVIAFHSLACFSMYYAAEAGGSSGRQRLLKSLGNTLTNPIVVALLLGLVLNLGGVVLPGAVMQAIDLVSGATLPCALLSLGASLTALHLRRLGAATAITVVKLVIFPLLVLTLATLALHVPPAAKAVLVILSSCPVGINAAFVIRADNRDTQLVDSSILLSSILCTATIPFWLWSLKMM